MRNSLPLQNRFRLSLLGLAVVAMTLFVVTPVNSCPFCSAVARTFTEQMDSSDIVVIATLATEPKSEDSSRLPEAKFKINAALKGEAKVGDDFTAVVVSRKIKIGDKFLVMGSGTDAVNWTTPLKVSETVVEYLSKLHELPEKGGKRLEFFADFFEHEESVLAYDAYDEFARASYDDVKELKNDLDTDKLMGWIEDPEVMQSRKRLYYTLLGVTGPSEDKIAFLEGILKSGDRDRQSGLDALIACYLTLRGPEGMPLIESTFLNNVDAEYIDVFSAITALRFHGTEADIIPQTRIVQALRFVLDRPKMADMVIPDLARWEDWSVMERLVKMFKECDTDETRWVRTPIISYLQDCPKEEAKSHLAELRELDPDAAKRADMLADLDWGDDDDDWGDDEEDEDTEEATDTEASDQVPAPKPPAESESTEQEGEESGDGQPVSAVVTASANSPATSYVTTVEPSTAPNPIGKMDDTSTDPENEQLAQRAVPTPPAAVIVPASPSVTFIILVTLGVCVILFLLLWSVLNGYFERLIF